MVMPRDCLTVTRSDWHLDFRLETQTVSLRENRSRCQMENRSDYLMHFQTANR